ncbi:MAG: molybdate ABC transporter substrate-binding protein [Deltaproteobacteria bacterium]|nr:molybdate ABC transporter substrate-binding protein [Deltaproteobacteria bacterium]
MRALAGWTLAGWTLAGWALAGWALAGCALAGCALAGCTRSGATAPEDALVIFAATSLRDAFTALGDDFRSTHPGTELTFNFAGTQELRTQLEHGAPVDVFASADQLHMDELVRTARVFDPVVFARNELVIVVALEGAARLRTLADLPSADRVVIGAPEVPVGRYALEILDRAGSSLGADFRSRVEAKVVSRELNARQVLAKVSLGEAQAGFVYRTDAQAAQERVRIVSIPSDLSVIAEYPIAIVSGAAHPALARAFVDLLRSASGLRALGEAGFLAPAETSTTP